jgi:hypothetical protein
METKMETQILIPAVVALISLIASHQFAAWRDRENKRREHRVNYLIQAFRSLSKANHHPKLYEIADEVEQALSDIQFLGNNDQIVAAQQFAGQLGTDQTADLDPVLFSLRSELRKELGREEYSGKMIWLRIGRKDSQI